HESGEISGRSTRRLRGRNTKKRFSISNGNKIRAAMPGDDVDRNVKLAIYEITAETGRVPNSSEISRLIQIEENEVITAFGRLRQKRLLIPEPVDPSRIRMAPPFSGVPTAFPVEANGKQYYANCVWDAYGIAAALHCDAISRASDGYTGEPL